MLTLVFSFFSHLTCALLAGRNSLVNYAVTFKERISGAREHLSAHRACQHICDRIRGIRVLASSKVP